MDIDLRDWQVSQTGITNFTTAQFGTYEELIRRMGDPNLVIVEQPMPPMLPGSGGSVHYLVGKRQFVSRSTMTNIYIDVRNEEANGATFWYTGAYTVNFGIQTIQRKVIVDPLEAYKRAMKGI